MTASTLFVNVGTVLRLPSIVIAIALLIGLKLSYDMMFILNIYSNNWLWMAFPVILAPLISTIIFYYTNKKYLICVPIAFSILDILFLIWGVYDYFKLSYVQGIVIFMVFPLVFISSIVSWKCFLITKTKSIKYLTILSFVTLIIIGVTINFNVIMQDENYNINKIKKILCDRQDKTYVYKENIYFINKDRRDELYKVKIGDKKVHKLTYSSVKSIIKVKDNYIHYVSDDGVYKMKIDGTEEIKISNAYINKSFIIIDECIYWTSNGRTNKLNKLDLRDGTLKTIAENADYIISILDVDKDNIYYELNNGIFKIDSDGLSEMELVSLEGQHLREFNVINGYAYWIQDFKNLYRKKIGNTEKEEKLVSFDGSIKSYISNDKSVYINVSIDKASERHIYKLNFDEKKKILVYDEKRVEGINLFKLENGNVYFWSINNSSIPNYQLYEILENGKIKIRKIESDIKKLREESECIYYEKDNKIIQMNVDGTKRILFEEN